MAGTLPDVPGYRFPIDADGTILGFVRASDPANFVNIDSEKVTLSDDSNTLYWTPARVVTEGISNHITVTLVFPEPRNLVGYYISTYRPSIDGASYTPGNIEVSTDTTNGLDGTWAVTTAMTDNTNDNNFRRRAEIQSMSATDAKGVRFVFTKNADVSGTDLRIYELHVYGDIPAGANDQRLQFWHSTEDQPAGYAYFDWGDMAGGEVKSKAVRLKNLDPVLTAQSISLDISDISPGTPMGTNMLVSTDGVTWMSVVNIGNLAPGAVSAPLYVQFTMPGGPTDVFGARVRAIPASWA